MTTAEDVWADSTPVRACRDCQRHMRPACSPLDGRPEHWGRELCQRCYQARRRAGTLTDAERATHSRDELLTDVQHLTAAGETLRQTAARLGVTTWAIYKARQRARSAA